jgi:Zn-finger nucleic acid-binding protein
MKCPVCKTPDLMMTERQSVEIDYCPQCRGVWLDRGELDKLLVQVSEMSGAPDGAPQRQADGHYRDRQHGDRSHDDRAYGDHRYGRDGYRKKRSLFDMFDFD